jgi:DDE superfamily endonuclease
MSDDSTNNNVTLTTMRQWNTVLAIVVGAVLKGTPLSRNPSIIRQKLLWNEYVSAFSDNQKFIRRHLRMTLPSFYKLLGLIRVGLEVDNEKADSRGGPILPELCLFCTLRWLAGGSYLDIFALTKVSIPSFYRVVYRTLRLIIDCKALEIKFPTTMTECKAAADGFRSISFREAITNCIGVIDGYLLRIYTPPKNTAGNVKSYYSGHYQCHGINIQAVCDHHSRFIFFAVAAPGSTNDRDAIKETELPKVLEAVPDGFVIIADAAYEPTERVVPMYYGNSRNNPEHDNFNFYASQCRIRVEMAFGLMQMKWGILWRPMRVKLDNIKFIMMAIARLHNFTVNERLANDEQTESVGVETERVYNPTVDVEEEIIVNNNNCRRHLVGLSIIRDEMVDRVKSLELTRPINNIIRTRNNNN